MGPFTVKLTFPKAHCCGAGKPGVQLRKRELQDAQGRCLYLGGLPSESREQRILGSVLGESSTGHGKGHLRIWALGLGMSGDGSYESGLWKVKAQFS